MKRFWKEVTVADGAIALDGRPVKTPGRAALALPAPALAEAVAEEWRAVGETVDPRAMPLTGLANAAIDRIGADPASFAAGLAKYGESDLLCYRAAEPPELAQRQAAAWNPPLDWAEGHYGVQFALAQGVMHVAQPPATVARLAEAVDRYDAFRLAGLSPVVTVTGSLVLGLAVAEAAMTPDAAWSAAQIDDAWQEEQWGADPLAEAARAAHRRDFDAGARFLALLG
jgi:chaperone required for assembly of F1-ATPase